MDLAHRAGCPSFRSCAPFGAPRGGRLATDRTILKIPLVGSLVQRLNVARIMRTFGSLLENGVAMLAALEIVRNIAGNTIVAEALHAAARDVGQGQSLSRALGANPRALSTAGDPDDRCRRTERQARADAGQDRRHV